MIQAVRNIQLIVSHVGGESNPDALLRVHMDKCGQCKMDLINKGFKEWEVPRNVFILGMEL